MNVRLIMMKFVIALLLIIPGLPATATDSKSSPVSNCAAPVRWKVGSISGVVYDPISKGIEGVTIVASPRGSESRSAVIVVSYSKGRFNFPPLAAGAYELQAVVNEGWLMTRPTKSVIVRAGENTAIEFQLRFIEGCGQNAGTSVSLGPADKTEIVRWIVTEVIDEEMKKSPIPQKGSILSTHKIATVELPDVVRSRIQLKTPEEIQRVANREGDYMYWQFEEFRVAGSCIAVSLANLWADGTSTIETGPTNRGGEQGYLYAFQKQNGKWIGKFMMGRIF